MLGENVNWCTAK